MEHQNVNGEIESLAREREAAVPVAVAAKKRNMWRYDVVLRLTSLTFSLAAAVLLGLAVETETVRVAVNPTRPPVSFLATAKWSYLPSFVFFVVANAITCVYASITIILTLATRIGKMKINALWVIFFDILAIGLLGPAIGATGAIGHLAYKGNEHVHWTRVCNVFDELCHRAISSAILSFVAVMGFLLAAMLAIINLRKKPYI